MDNKKVAAYYDYTIPFYKLFWHKGTNALHYGLWDETTRSLQDALVNTNRILADIAHVQKETKVLDAGCGVGGSAIWLAKNREARVTGITISTNQKEKAKKYARRDGVSDKTTFLVQDYLRTNFPDATFDVVWAIESVCHAKDKKDFIAEAYRLLKPGGRLIVADGFLGREPATDNERRAYEIFNKGFALDNLALTNSFMQDIHDVGFKNAQMRDVTEEIMPTVEIMHHMSTRWLWVNEIARALRLIPQLMVDNVRTGIVQKAFFTGPGVYAIFYGEK